MRRLEGHRKLSKSQTDDADDFDTRMSPDPFAAVLPALAALGAITSIAAINWSGQDKVATRTRISARPLQPCAISETCCLGLAEIFRSLQRHPRVFAGEGGQAAAPL